MDVLQTKHSLWPDSSPIHMLFLNVLFCSVGTQVEMKISAAGGAWGLKRKRRLLVVVLWQGTYKLN